MNRARLLADDPDHGVEEALEAVAAAEAEAAAHGSPVNELWARTVRAFLVLRTDLPTGLDLTRGVLESARRFRYPSITREALRSLAWAATRTGDYPMAASALGELFDGVLTRGAVADLRAALHTTAELLHATADPAWAPIAATAQCLPRLGLAIDTVDPSAELPSAPGVEPLSQREAVTLARQSLQRLLSEPAQTTTAAAAAAEAARLLDRGEFWEITFAGRSVHAKASKGLNDLTRLLSNPGREIHCLDLIGAGVEQPSLDGAIDDTARRQYEQRIRDLQADVDAAEADNDFARAEKAQVELDALVEHLTAALGLGGRSRRGSGSTERARSAVTQRIRATIRRLAREHPELARHLDASIATGIYCAYRPEPPIMWEIST